MAGADGIRGTGAREALAAIEANFQAHVEVQHKIHDMARRHEFELGKKALNSQDTPLWRKYKDQILEFRKSLESESKRAADGIERDSRLAGAESAVAGFVLILASLAAFATSLLVERQLTGVAGNLREGAGQVARAAGQIAVSSQMLAQGASQEATSLEETSASSQETTPWRRKTMTTRARRPAWYRSREKSSPGPTQC